MRQHTRMSSIATLSLVLGIAGLAVAACSDADTDSDSASSGTAAPTVVPTESSNPTSDPPPDTPATSDSTSEEFALTVALSEPTAIDPALVVDVEGAHVTRLLFENLVKLSPELELEAGVATEWSQGPDGLTWTFVLDPAAVYSDGRPVVADDFVAAWARVADPDLAAPSAYQGLPIAGWADVLDAEPSGAIGDVPVSGVAAVDDHTLTVTTEEPFALLPKVLTYSIFAPVPAEFVESEDAASAFFDLPVGNGPYMMAEPWQHNERITLMRNPNYVGTPGVADTIQFRIYGDLLTGYTDFEAGDLDIARMLPPEAVGPARDTYPDTFVATRTGVLTYIGFPTDVAPFDDPDIRKAFSLAIDREAIAERVFEGTASPATGVVPPLAPGALDGVCDGCTYDPERARDLFDAAGGVPNNTIVVYDIADDGDAGLAPILNSWREVFGIEIEVRSFEFGQFLEEIAPGNAVGPFELGWAWDYPSGYSFLSPLFESTSDVNNLSWADEAFDEQIRSAREAPDEEAGLAFLAEAQRIVEAALPIAPVTFADDVGVYGDSVTNVVVDAAALWRLELIEPAA